MSQDSCPSSLSENSLQDGPGENLPQDDEPELEFFLPHYVPSHVAADDCPMLSVGEGRLWAAATAGKTVLVAFDDTDGDGPARLCWKEVDRRDPHTAEYTAISHVRAEGLGNTESSSLPTCQIRRLQALVDELNGSPQRCTMFWIDTLCLPYDLPVKSKAMQDIYYIFKNAAKTLVVEPSLCGNETRSTEESLRLIRGSPWLQRLWTLQEGVISPRLFFQFANGAVELDLLLQQRSPNMQLVPSPLILERTERLSCDIKAANLGLLRELGHFQNTLHELQMSLFSCLRLCYFSLLPRFRMFVEAAEEKIAVRVQAVLEDMYNHVDADAAPNERKVAERLVRVLESYSTTQVKI